MFTEDTLIYRIAEEILSNRSLSEGIQQER
jgi:hypothetical protein